MTERQALQDLVAGLHNWPGGAPNEVWSAVSAIKTRLDGEPARIGIAIAKYRAEALTHPEPDRAALVERLNGAARHWGHDVCGNPETCPMCDIAGLFREAAAALESIATREWIPVGEQLPGNDDDVLTVIAGQIVIGYLHSSGRWKSTQCNDLSKLTHWMPLPEPPHE